MQNLRVKAMNPWFAIEAIERLLKTYLEFTEFNYFTINLLTELYLT